MAGRRKNPYVFYQDRRKHRGRGAFRFLVILLLFLLLSFIGLGFLLSHDVQYARVQITIPNLPSDMEGFAILQLSDLQGKADDDLVRRIEKHVKSRSWSCLVMTGDMLGTEANPEGILKICKLFPDDLPKFLILGDEDPDYLVPYAHENLTALAQWALELEDAGITILDEPYLITRGRKEEARLWLVPEDLYTIDIDTMLWVYEGQQKQYQSSSLTAAQEAQKRVADYQVNRCRSIQEKIASMQSTDIQIALTHVPVTEEAVRRNLADAGSGAFSYRRISLILAGHYVGGEWCLPGFGAIYVPDLGWFPEDSQVTGLSYPGGNMQYISPGLSTSGIYTYQPGRFMNPSVITSLELTNKMQ